MRPDHYISRFQAYDHVYWLAVFWLRFRFDTLGRLVIALLTAGCAVFGIAQGWSAFAIVQAEAFVAAVHAVGLDFYEHEGGCTKLSISIEQVVWSAAQLQLDLNAIERIDELLQLTPEETSTRTARTPAYWPSNTGAIHVESLEFRYDPTLPAVVKDLSLHIPAKRKLAIVGRTGSGKSTLASSLLRVRDPCKGAITIDGIDITTLGLNDLRSRLSVVPQEPTLFMGTLRFNLDPMDEHTDQECLRALELMGLSSSLDESVAAGGKNYSAGERNLIALAVSALGKLPPDKTVQLSVFFQQRAILRQSNVLILECALLAEERSYRTKKMRPRLILSANASVNPLPT